jgi:hypothetical protein
VAAIKAGWKVDPSEISLWEHVGQRAGLLLFNPHNDGLIRLKYAYNGLKAGREQTTDAGSDKRSDARKQSS